MSKYCGYCASRIFDDDRVCEQCGAPTRKFVVRHKDILPETTSGDMSHQYDELESLETFTFVSGTTWKLNFDIRDEYSIPIDYIDGTWNLRRLGKSYEKVLSIALEEDGSVLIPHGETENLEGEFIQQVILKDYNGDKFYLPQGRVLILGSACISPPKPTRKKLLGIF